MARPGSNEGLDSSHRRPGSCKVDSNGVDTPSSNGALVGFARGKLTVKIVEARGLRRSKEPYVVAIFQRNELVSSGPRDEDTTHENASPVSAAGISMSRQGSEFGRSMAIPMKSRQSSSTSLSDHRQLQQRRGRKSFTSPKWFTEAIL
jgi:hypothetical protein